MARRRQRYPWQGMQPTLAAVQPPYPDPMEFMDQQDVGDGGDNWGYGRTRPQSPLGADVNVAPEEEAGYLRKGMNALEWAADSMSKGGYALRGAYAGEENSLLNLIPFYDTLQNYMPETLPEAPKVTGKDILEREGWDKDSWKTTAAGFGIDLIDPMMGVSFFPKVAKGAKVAAEVAGLAADVGKGAKTARLAKMMREGKAGLDAAITPVAAAAKAPTFVNQIRAGDRAGIGFGLPFADPLFYLGAGSPTVAKIAEFGGYNPLVRGLRGMFSTTPGVRGTMTKAAQIAADEAAATLQPMTDAVMNSMPALKGVDAQWKDIFRETAESLGKQGDPAGAEELATIFRTMKEGLPDPDEMVGKLADYLGVPRTAPAIERLAAAEETKNMLHRMNSVLEDTPNAWHELLQSYGSPTKTWYSKTERYAPRLANQSIFTQTDLEEARRTWLNLIPESTVTSNRMSQNPVLIGVRTLPATDEATQAAAAGGKKLFVNAVVHAADQQNYGRVLTIGKDESLVRFVSPEGAVAQVTLPNEALTVTRNAPAEVMQRAVVAPLEKVEHQGLLQKWLGDKATELRAAGQTARAATVEKAMTSGEISTMQQAMIEEGFLRPTIDNLLARGVVDQKYSDDFFFKLRLPGKVETIEGGISTTKNLPSNLKQITDGITKLPKQVAESGLFDWPQVEVAAEYNAHAAEKFHILRTMHNFLRQPGVLAKGTGITADSKKLVDVWSELGMTRKGLEKFAAESMPGQVVDLDGLKISAQAAKTLGAYQKMFTTDAAGEFGNFVDKFTAPFKSWWTTKPAFYPRNMAGGWWNSVADGEVNPAKLTRNYGKLWAWTLGKGDLGFVEEGADLGLFRGSMMMDINNVRAFAKQYERGGVSKAIRDIPRALAHPVESWQEGLLQPHLVGGATGETNVVSNLHHQLNQFVEFLNRGAYYQTLREKGWTPAAAIHAVTRTQFDYSKRHPIMSRLVPFWGWVSNNLPLQLERLAKRPMGSPTGLATYALGHASENQDYIPEFMREGVAFRLPEGMGGGPPEARSFFKQTGLPLEDLNKFVLNNKGTLASVRTLEKFASMLNPAIGIPLEQLTGRQLWSGRKLADLEPLYGSPLLAQVVSRSPFSSQAADIRTVFDSRKPWWQRAANLTTGGRFGTYNENKLKRIDVIKAIKEELLANSGMVGSTEVPYLKRQFKNVAEAAPVKAKLKKLRGLTKVNARLEKERELRESLLAPPL